jgi:hypothetical protein
MYELLRWLNIRQQQSSRWSQRFRQYQKSTEAKESCGRTRTITDTTIFKTEVWTVGNSYSKTGIPKSSVHRVWTGMIAHESSMTMQYLTAQTIKTVFTDYNWEALPHLTTGKPCPTSQPGTPAPPYNWEPLPHLTTGNHWPTLLTALIWVPWFRSAPKAERIAAWSMISVFRNTQHSGDTTCRRAQMQSTNKWYTKITGHWEAIQGVDGKARCVINQNTFNLNNNEH